MSSDRRITARPRRYDRAETVEDIARNMAAVEAGIADAAARAGRDADDVRLLVVSKTVDERRIRLAVKAGCHRFGENKVQEAVRKYHALSDIDVEWSVIGHLQTNKARDVAAFASEFHALDRLAAAEALDRRLQASGHGLDVYVQVNTSAEQSKYGLPPDETLAFLRQMPAYTALRVRGLMTLAVFSDDIDRIRPCFASLRELRDRARDIDPALVGPGGLSMGMSGDYAVAVEEGATVVRVGQAIFGARPTPDEQYWPGGN